MSYTEAEEVRRDTDKVLDDKGVSSEEEDTPETEKKDDKEEQKKWTEEDIWKCLNPAPSL